MLFRSVGATIRCEAELTEVDRRRLVFEVKCFEGETLVGEGIHERFVVESEKFMTKMKKLLTFCAIVLSVVMMTACKGGNGPVQPPQVEGHYTYEHAFNYVSPSRWHLDGEDFHFAGLKENFRMELVETAIGSCDSTRAAELAQQIVKVVGGSIDYEYKFHLDSLTSQKMQWSFAYPDGHSDTWEFYRNQK